MRLERHEIEAIRAAGREVFGPTVAIRVFGSRVRDDAKGGDLDLHLEVEPGQATLDLENAFLRRIEGPLDELKTDVVLYERGTPPRLIDQVAREDGVLL